MLRQLLLLTLVLCTPLAAATLESVLGDEGRLPADLERDTRSHPQAVLPLLNLQPGDRVADIFGGGGYYSELIAALVGPRGEVILHNNAAYRAFASAGLALRFSDRDPGPITLLDSEADDLALGIGTLDAALIILSYHDLFYGDPEGGWPQIDDADFMGQIHAALKSGGRLLIVDHAAAVGAGARAAESLHRIEESYVVGRLTAQGFRLIDTAEALRDAADDHTLSVFDPAVRGRTDRFVLVFEKP